MREKKIQEACLYNRAVFCGGVVERYKRCWRCSWNPQVVHDRKLINVPLTEPEKVHAQRVRTDTKDPIDWDYARELYDEGCNDYKIAVFLCCSPSSVWKWRQTEGLPARRKQQKDWDEPEEYIPLFRNSHINWEAAKRYYDMGMCDAEIAKKVNCAASSVFGWRRRMGLRPNKYKKEPGAWKTTR